MKVKIYLEKGATLPQKAHDTDYGYDIRATSKELKGRLIVYGTGIHIALPERYNDKAVCMKVYARSSVCNTGLVLSNGVGIIDSGYRGEIKAVFYSIANGKTYGIGDRIAQIAPSNDEDIEWEQVATLDELGQTDRGSGGYGSTGR